MKAGTLLLRLHEIESHPDREKKREFLVTLRDGFNRDIHRKYHQKPNIRFSIPIAGNSADQYTVIVWSKTCAQAGFRPVSIKPDEESIVDLPLFPDPSMFNFNRAKWDSMLQTHLEICDFLKKGEVADPAKQLEETWEESPNGNKRAAALLLIATAASQVQVGGKSLLNFLAALHWDELAQDRFFAYADPDLPKLLKSHSQFEKASPFFHKDSDLSFKEKTYAAANVQLSFASNNKKTIDGRDFIGVDVDIDYYPDMGAHGILEVIPNTLLGRLTEPRHVYLLRWIAARRANKHFRPPVDLVLPPAKA